MARKNELSVLHVMGEELHGMDAHEDLCDILAYELGSVDLDWLKKHPAAVQALLYCLDPRSEEPKHVTVMDADGLHLATETYPIL